MADPSRCADLAAPHRASARRPYRDRVPTTVRLGVSLSLTGTLNHNSRRQVRTAVEQWCEVSQVVPFAAIAHVDISEVTHLDPTGIDLLNESYTALTNTGWRFRVTPPADANTRLAFLEAVVDGRLRWA